MRITAILLMIPFFLFAQTNKHTGYKQKQVLIFSGLLIAGFLDGQSEVIKSDFSRYQRVHPLTNPNWSNPILSFKNKYKDWPTDTREKFFGSTTVFVWTTDKYHLNRTLRNGLMMGSTSLSMSLYEKPSLKQIVKQAALSWVFYLLGTGIAHSIVYKK